MKKLSGPYLDFDFAQLIPIEQSLAILPTLEQKFFQNYSDEDRSGKKRSAVLVGDPNVSYHVSYGGYKGRPLVSFSRTPISWDLFPEVFALKEIIEPVSKSTFNVCVIQRYPNGKVGIAPHRDKEIVQGLSDAKQDEEKIMSGKIVGFSIGATRILRLTPPSFLTNCQFIDIPLTSGSLYQINPPTNQYWLHSIEKDPQITEVRYSLTFRYVKPNV